MKLYLKLYFNSEGMPTLEIIKRARKMGFRPSVGYYDFVIDFHTPEDYSRILDELHNMLKGTKALYTVMTRED
ncbi:MAG: hypothetical protein PHU53_01970 [Thermoplasmata archaeon]|nr:hypothetical protein [Thermoplasmata archaeon]